MHDEDYRNREIITLQRNEMLTLPAGWKMMVRTPRQSLISAVDDCLQNHSREEVINFLREELAILESSNAQERPDSSDPEDAPGE